MDLDTVIHCPDSIRGGHFPWTGTLAEAIKRDSDRMAQDAEGRGLPMADHEDHCLFETGKGELEDCDCGRDVAWELLTLAQWRTVLDDPNARIVE